MEAVQTSGVEDFTHLSVHYPHHRHLGQGSDVLAAAFYVFKLTSPVGGGLDSILISLVLRAGTRTQLPTKIPGQEECMWALCTPPPQCRKEQCLSRNDRQAQLEEARRKKFMLGTYCVLGMFTCIVSL